MGPSALAKQNTVGLNDSAPALALSDLIYQRRQEDRQQLEHANLRTAKNERLLSAVMSKFSELDISPNPSRMGGLKIWAANWISQQLPEKLQAAPQETLRELNNSAVGLFDAKGRLLAASFILTMLDERPGLRDQVKAFVELPADQRLAPENNTSSKGPADKAFVTDLRLGLDLPLYPTNFFPLLALYLRPIKSGALDGEICAQRLASFVLSKPEHLEPAQHFLHDVFGGSSLYHRLGTLSCRKNTDEAANLETFLKAFDHHLQGVERQLSRREMPA